MSWRRKLWLALEMLALFGAAPVIIYELLFSYRVPLFTILPPVFVLFVILLTLDGGFSWVRTLFTGIPLRVAAQIVAVFLVLGGALTGWALETHPQGVLRFARALPDVWLMVMLLYPLLSVTTQEIVYRVFFFHRYADLFGSQRLAAIAVNGALFAFSHIIFQSWVTLVISFVGGALFAYRYVQTRSYWAVVVEHSLYGNLIFTLGLGRYFYTGVSNFG